MFAEGAALTRPQQPGGDHPEYLAAWLAALRELRLRGVGSMVVLVEPNSFGAGGSVDDVAAALTDRIPTRRLRNGDPVGLGPSGLVSQHHGFSE